MAKYKPVETRSPASFRPSQVTAWRPAGDTIGVTVAAVAPGSGPTAGIRVDASVEHGGGTLESAGGLTDAHGLWHTQYIAPAVLGVEAPVVLARLGGTPRDPLYSTTALLNTVSGGGATGPLVFALDDPVAYLHLFEFRTYGRYDPVGDYMPFDIFRLYPSCLSAPGDGDDIYGGHSITGNAGDATGNGALENSGSRLGGACGEQYTPSPRHIST